MEPTHSMTIGLAAGRRIFFHMFRTLLHVFIAVAWAIFAPSFLMQYLESAPSTPDVTVWAVRLLGVVAIITLGLFAALWSWLMHDAMTHGKPKSTALAYALASIPSCGLAMVAYFYSTRGRKEATIAAAQFFAIFLGILTAIAQGH